MLTQSLYRGVGGERDNSRCRAIIPFPLAARAGACQELNPPPIPGGRIQHWASSLVQTISLARR